MDAIKKQFRFLAEKNDGYLTIEMTIIFPAIFFSLLLILFMGIVLYQEVNQQSLVIEASERGSMVYSSRVSDMTTGIKTLKDFENRDPYRNVPFMGRNDKSAYTSLVNNYVSARKGRNALLSGSEENEGNYTEIEDYLITKRVKVELHTDYRTPIDSIADSIGLSHPFDVDTTAASAIVDTPDFVRNIDIIIDVAKQTDAFDTIQDGYNKIKDAIEKVSDFLK